MQKSYSTSLQSSTISSSTGNMFSNLGLFDDHHHHHVDSSTSTDRYPQSILGKSLRNTLKKALSQNSLTVVHVNDFDPTELARQLTLMENSLFCRIRPNEMIGQEFKKKVGTSQAVHVKAMIQRSTQITSWVSDTILNEADTKKRAQVLKYWIKVGDVSGPWHMAMCKKTDFIVSGMLATQQLQHPHGYSVRIRFHQHRQTTKDLGLHVNEIQGHVGAYLSSYRFAEKLCRIQTTTQDNHCALFTVSGCLLDRHDFYR